MPLQTYFRSLLLIFVLLVGAEIVSDFTTVSWLPDPLRNFVEDQMNSVPADEDLSLLGFLSLVSLALMFVSVTGLWYFWRPARVLYTIFLLALACAVAASGNVVESALTSVLAFMNTIIAGVILGMIYFSPLRENFDAPSPENPAM